MLFDRQQELISGETVGCYGDRAAYRGCLGSQCSLHHPGLWLKWDHSATPGKHTSNCWQLALDRVGQGKN